MSHDWEDLSPTDEQLQELNNDLHATTSKFVSSTEIKPSLQLSAEAVAKSLLQKFGNTSHPAACELQWLVSFQDAPQSLLPLPQTVAVAPDDVPQVDAMRRHAVSRQNSLPVICGNINSFALSVLSFVNLVPCVYLEYVPSCVKLVVVAVVVAIVHLTNRFHVAVRLFSNRSQMTSKCD